MHRVECVIDVEHDTARCARKGVAVEPDHLCAHRDQRTCIGQIFHARDRGLRTQGRAGFGTTLKRDLEAGIVPQAGSVIAIFIARGNHHDRQADDVVQAVLNLGRVAWIGHAGRCARPALRSI